MARSPLAPCAVYALVPAREARATLARKLGARLVRGEQIAALAGGPPASDLHRAAVEHDRVVGAALEACTSVVPFRLGVTLPSEGELSRLLIRDEEAIAAALRRLCNRVEMGFKVRLSAAAEPRRALAPPRLPSGLERVRALAPNASDRREAVAQGPQGTFFTGCYLIDRTSVEAFWSAVAEVRRRAPSLPVLGSGPWAAYSFVNLVLRIETQAEVRR